MENSKLTIWPLGSMGWIPSLGMETVCYCFFHGDEIFILDTGSGIRRLLELKNSLFIGQWAKLKHARIFLTHYHFDHCIGLFWLKAIFPGVPVTVYGPGEALYGKSVGEIISKLFQKPYSPNALDSLVPGIKFVDADPNGVEVKNDAGKIKVAINLNPEHSDPSISYKFNDWFAFVTDTPPKQEIIEFVRGVKVLFHEAYFDSTDRFKDENDDLETHIGGPHTGSFGAGLVAKRAGVKKLVLFHHNPENTIVGIEKYAREVGERLGLDCVPSMDLREIKIGL
ncbi:MAG: MBL fold metallo-hydrolase [bacterium]|nr:MBL fold metallo-hydrolase [bacterium]